MSEPNVEKPRTSSTDLCRQSTMESYGDRGADDMRLFRWLRRAPDGEQSIRELKTELRQERQLSRLVKAEYQERVVRGVLSEIRKTN